MPKLNGTQSAIDFKSGEQNLEEKGAGHIQERAISAIRAFISRDVITLRKRDSRRRGAGRVMIDAMSAPGNWA